MNTCTLHSKKNSQKKGFTLIETLVAISLLSIVIASVMALVQASLVANTYSKDEVTAKYLAEEGIEYIRHMRDENMVNNLIVTPRNWMQNIAADNSANSPCGDITSGSSVKICDIDSLAGGNPIACTTGSPAKCDALLYNPATGFYSHVGGAGQASKFTRTIKVTRVDGGSSPYSVVVSVVVSWNENAGPQTYSVSDYLFNWYPAS